MREFHVSVSGRDRLPIAELSTERIEQLLDDLLHAGHNVEVEFMFSTIENLISRLELELYIRKLDLRWDL